VKKLVTYLNKDAKVLDIGCGEGRNALFLSKHNINVTAIDTAQQGIDKVKALSQNAINTQCIDALSYLKQTHQFDAIIAIHVLQLIDDRKKVIEEMKNNTKKNGFNIIASFKECFDQQELKKLYEDWDILLYEEKLTDWETHGEKPHRHNIVHIIAKKVR